MKEYAQQFIQFLVTSGTLQFGDFTLKSGRKCPYFFNFGKIFEGQQAYELAHYYASALQEKNIDFDVIFGPAYKGIPLSVALSLVLFKEFGMNTSYCFNRKEVKDHGEGGMLVGAPLNSQTKVLLIDDVVTAGTALRQTFDILQKSGAPIIQGALIAVDRMEKGQSNKSAIQEIEEELGIKMYSIVSLNEVVDYLGNRAIDGKVYLNEVHLQKIREYRTLFGV